MKFLFSIRKVWSGIASLLCLAPFGQNDSTKTEINRKVSYLIRLQRKAKLIAQLFCKAVFNSSWENFGLGLKANYSKIPVVL
jgi:hypothetical protein